MKKIGVFDSGIGGKSIADAIESAFPKYLIDLKQDKNNVPYGNKSKSELLILIKPFIDQFADNDCGVIVIACNTVTTNIIKDIREMTKIPIIGIEPMLKPAALATKSKIIAVCATPTTLSSDRYGELKKEFAKHIQVIEPDCSEWSQMIESNSVDSRAIKGQIEKVCLAGADVIVLGCTHYHWIEKEIADVSRLFKAKVIQPEEAIVRRLSQVLEQLA